MLNPALRKSMLPEYRALYDLNKPLTDEVFKQRLTDAVRHIRKLHRKVGANKLEDRLEKYGNSGGRYREHVKEAVKRLYKHKGVPSASVGLWRSIEFECIFKTPRSLEEFGVAIRNAGLDKFVTIQTDPSIKRNPYDTVGVPQEVVLSYRTDNENAVRVFCKCLKGRAYVNQSCGTHFHIDARNLTPEKVTEYGTRLAQAVPMLRLLLPKERRENKHCNKTINTVQTECIRPHKYTFVNLAAYNKHRTIEVRGHSGTINAEKILNWIKLCEHVALNPIASSTPLASIEEFITAYKLDNHLIAYVKDRYSKFNNNTPAWDYPSYSQNQTEGEETPDETVEVPVHPSLLTPQPTPVTPQPPPAPFTLTPAPATGQVIQVGGQIYIYAGNQ